MKLLSVVALIAVALVALLSRVYAWDDPENLTYSFNPSEGDYFPDITSDHSGNLHVVWCSSINYNNWQIYHLYRSSGGVWSSPVAVGGANANWCREVVDSAGNLHVCWHGGSSQANNEVFYRKRLANGAWEPIVNVSNTSGVASMFPDIAVDGLGQVFVVWHENIADGGQNWEMAMARFDGANWQPYERITNSSKFDVYPVVACDSSNTLHVVWTSYDEIYYKTRSSAGVWTSELNISNNGGSSRDPDLAVAPSGDVHAVWHDNSLSNWEYYYRAKIGGGWQAIQNLSNNASAVDAYGAVAVGGDGSVNVVWMDYASVYFNRNSGTGFSGVLTLFAGTNLKHAKVCVDPSNRVHVVWQDRTPGAWDIQYLSQAYPDLNPPGVVTNFSGAGSDAKVYLNWKNPSDLDYKGTLIRYKTTGYPTGPTDGTLLLNRISPRGSSDSYTHGGLVNGVTYYYTAFSYDTEGNYAAGANAQVAAQAHNASTVKQLANGSPVDLAGRIVTAYFSADNAMYVEDPDRTGGIRVAVTAAYSPGDVVNVSGSMADRIISSVAAERMISSAVVAKTGTTAPVEPVHMNNEAVGGATNGLALGVKNAVGLNNMGLLVTIHGKVTMAVGSIIYIDDGSNVENIMGLDTPVSGVMVKGPVNTTAYPVGSYVRVTGILEGSVPSGWTQNRPYLRVRGSDWSDVTLVAAP